MTGENSNQFMLSPELQVMLANTAEMFIQLFVELTFLVTVHAHYELAIAVEAIERSSY